ncbi:MAG: hypothetical protein WBM86_17230 [Waterburya sp.]
MNSNSCKSNNWEINCFLGGFKQEILHGDRHIREVMKALTVLFIQPHSEVNNISG